MPSRIASLASRRLERDNCPAEIPIAFSDAHFGSVFFLGTDNGMIIPNGPIDTQLLAKGLS